jgi:hypothetical protein
MGRGKKRSVGDNSMRECCIVIAEIENGLGNKEKKL